MPSTKVNDLVIYDPADWPADGFAQLLLYRYRTARTEQEQADAEMALAELGLWVYLAWWPGCVRGPFVPPRGCYFGEVVAEFDCVVRGIDCDDEPCTVVLHTASASR